MVIQTDHMEVQSMRRSFAFALCAPLLIGTLVHAQEVPQNYIGFTLDYLTRGGDNHYAGPFLSSISNTGGIARFSLDAVKYQQYLEGLESGYTNDVGRLGFTVSPGYKIVGFELSGDLSGSLNVRDASHVPGLISQSLGEARNFVRIQMDNVDYGSPILWNPTDSFVRWFNIEQPTPFSFGFTGEWVGQVALEMQFWTAISTDMTTYQAEYGGRWYEGRIHSFASVRIENPVLSVLYTPITEVPEPASWLMLLGGLVPVSLFSWRRHSARRKHRANAA